MTQELHLWPDDSVLTQMADKQHTRNQLVREMLEYGALYNSIEAQCNAAQKRLAKWINRSCGQHLRAYRKTWGKAE
jgi:hypothetical protein